MKRRKWLCYCQILIQNSLKPNVLKEDPTRDLKQLLQELRSVINEEAPMSLSKTEEDPIAAPLSISYGFVSGSSSLHLCMQSSRRALLNSSLSMNHFCVTLPLCQQLSSMSWNNMPEYFFTRAKMWLGIMQKVATCHQDKVLFRKWASKELLSLHLVSNVKFPTDFTATILLVYCNCLGEDR